MSFIIPIPGNDDLAMRLLEPHHAESVWPLIDTHREHIAEWLPWPYASKSLEDCRASIESLHRDFGERRGMALSIVLGEQIVGGTGWSHWRQGEDYGGSWQRGSADIGYWLLPNYVGRGYVTRCVVALTELGFTEYGLFRLTIRAEPGNARSRAVALRCGYVEEGVMRRVARFRDRWVDHHLFAAYAENWRRPQEAGDG